VALALGEPVALGVRVREGLGLTLAVALGLADWLGERVGEGLIVMLKAGVMEGLGVGL
jgi:hypothetical protein